MMPIVTPSRMAEAIAIKGINWSACGNIEGAKCLPHSQSRALQVKTPLGWRQSLPNRVENGRPVRNRPPIQQHQSQRRILRTDPSSRWMVTVRHPRSGSHFALAESRAVIVTTTVAVARTIRLADLDTDAGHRDSDALRIRLRGGVESDRCRGAQQDQQFLHEFSISLCRGGTSREEQWFPFEKLYCGTSLSPDAGRPEKSALSIHPHHPHID